MNSRRQAPNLRKILSKAKFSPAMKVQLKGATTKDVHVEQALLYRMETE